MWRKIKFEQNSYINTQTQSSLLHRIGTVKWQVMLRNCLVKNPTDDDRAGITGRRQGTLLRIRRRRWLFVEKLDAAEQPLDVLEGGEADADGDRTLDPVHAEALVQSTDDALRTHDVDESRPYRRVNVRHARHT